MKNIIKHNKTNGTTLMLVIAAIGFISVVLLYLSSASHMTMNQANNVYLQACERNLTSSGLSWAKVNLQNDTSDILNKNIVLDVNDMDIMNSAINIKINSIDNQQHEIQIETTCSKANKTLKTNQTFTID